MKYRVIENTIHSDADKFTVIMTMIMPRVKFLATNASNLTNQKGAKEQSGFHRHSDKHASGKIPKAQCAFKILMIHEVLQFALRIAFRCVLHRCGNLDIRR